MHSLFQELSSEELDKIKSRTQASTYQAGERVFTGGDLSDYIYFIESGLVSIFVDKFNSTEELTVLGPGECFGEMAMFFNDKRMASAAAKEQTTLLSIAKQEFLDFTKNEREIAEKIHKLLFTRNGELILREKLINATGLKGRHLHVSIKGAPSLRESALTCGCYRSEVDKILPELILRIEDLILNRCVYQMFIGFNSGEIRLSSILNPFCEELHLAKRLLDLAYTNRHFPFMDYDNKVGVIKSIYRSLDRHPVFAALPSELRLVFSKYYSEWKPVPKQDIARIISHLSQLRSIPNYYVRNARISMIKDTIHMQFNCDGAHIVSAEDYERFIEENL